MPEGLLARGQRVLSAAIQREISLPVVRAEGSLIETEDGARYIDLFAGIGVHALGHRHPEVMRAAREQMENLTHLGLNYGYYPPAVELGERLAEMCPGPLDAVFFGNSGAEGVEGAVKLARAATGRPGVVAFHGAFHGRTLGALSLTAASSFYRSSFEPLVPNVYHVPHPYVVWRRTGGEEAACVRESLDHLDALFRWIVRPEKIAAVVMEPVLGEGGYAPTPFALLRALREICDRHGIKLVLDEVQTGIGRTGRMFACEHVPVVPDILVLGKALGFGFPISAIVASRAMHDAWRPGQHGTTFGGHPVACAAALAGLTVMAREGIVERVAERGARMLERLAALRDLPGVVDVRGLGFMVAVEFARPDGSPDGERAEAVIRRCRERHVLILPCGADHNAVRLIPALNIPAELLDRALAILEEAVMADESEGRPERAAL